MGPKIVISLKESFGNRYRLNNESWSAVIIHKRVGGTEENWRYTGTLVKQHIEILKNIFHVKSVSYKIYFQIAVDINHS